MEPERLIAAFNRSPVWRRTVRVWGLILEAPKFDRWLYLVLHRCGLMGRGEKFFLERTLKPGMRAVDIGANVGLYALLMARLVGSEGKVFAFEPEPTMARALGKNLRLNPGCSVEFFAHALGAAPGLGILRRSSLNSGNSHLALAPWAPSAKKPEWEAAPSVPIRTLDEALAGRRLDFIKMDVQGWETQVLKGMSQAFELNPQLMIYFEFWPLGLRRAGSSPAELQQILTAHGLKIYHPPDGCRSGSVDLTHEEHRMRRGSWINLVAQRPPPVAA